MSVLNTSVNPSDYRDILGQGERMGKLSTSKVTDYNQGSVNRMLILVSAGMLSRFGSYLLQYAPELLTSTLYDLLAAPFISASRAFGTVTLTFTATVGAVTVPAGQGFRVPGTDRLYQAVAAVVVTIGATTVDVPIQAAAVGPLYNTDAATITQIVVSIPGLTAPVCTNQAAISTGTDDETAESRRLRFQMIFNAARRGTAGSLEAAAVLYAQVLDAYGRITESATKAKLVDTADGSAILYIANGTANAASGTLVTNCQTLVNGSTDPITGLLIDGYKAAGNRITVIAAAPVTVTITATLLLDNSYTTGIVQATLNNVVKTVFDRLGIGQTLYISSVLSAIRTVPGVGDVTVATFPGMNAYNAIVPTASQILIPGLITLAIQPPA